MLLIKNMVGVDTGHMFYRTWNIDTGTLDIMAKKNTGFDVTIYIFCNMRLSQRDITTFMHIILI